MTPEGRVKAKVKRELDKLVHWRFMPVQTGYGVPALDFICCIHGWFVAIETKKDGKAKLTDRQQATKADMEAAGGIVLVVYDDDSLARAMKVLAIICKGTTNGSLYQALARWANDAAQAQGPLEQYLRADQQGEKVAEATGGDHGAPRKEPRRRAQPIASVPDQRVTAAVTYFCVCCGLPTKHPSVLRSIPYCCGYPMKQNPMTNGS